MHPEINKHIFTQTTMIRSVKFELFESSATFVRVEEIVVGEIVGDTVV